ncbi:4d24a30b-412b-440f-ba8b-d20246d6cc23 [Sclerotinia trifoliorum]|uniref:DASH complex subunit DAD1 n=1 Tax=Sclerotinia trifoliorum TaxID=28548 RepID=A0A8H2W4J4_9HELO|nr:4d24a30b-412b-440f-ba8b-d20246d6cc23 [Sclerotinia trifoliorum]
MSSSTNRLPIAPEKSYFEQQREILLGEIAVSFEHVLSSINKLNRSLEGVIAVGNEFSSVEALWSQFENVMAKNPDPSTSTSTSPEDANIPEDEIFKSKSRRKENREEEEEGGGGEETIMGGENER